MSSLTWVLGTELGTSARAVWALTYEPSLWSLPIFLNVQISLFKFNIQDT